MPADVIEDAIAEARSRRRRSARDLTRDVEHYARTLPAVCADWGLEPVTWLPGGVNPPPLEVEAIAVGCRPPARK